MTGVGLKRFGRALAGARLVGLDTPVLIYHLEDVSSYAELTTHVLSRAAAGDLELVLSAVTVGEILAGPWRAGEGERARRIEEALHALPGIVVAEITWKAASKAAEIRGKSNLPLPDALIIASSVEKGATLLVTNDAGWRVRHLPCRVLLLDDYVRT